MICEFNPDFQITLDSDLDVCSGFTTLSASVILPVALKPSASKTIDSVFHLHNTNATRELSVCQFIWMASALGMSATQRILG